MRLSKLALGLTLFAGWALVGQVVPDWYVVELTETPVGKVRGASSVRDAQARVRDMISARLAQRAEVQSSTEILINSLIVRTDAGEAPLAAIPGVRRVWPVFAIHPELNRGVGLLRIREAWEAVGGSDRAGAGTKIGILDSGLTLSHPAFQSGGLAAPTGFPRATKDEMRGSLNGKVIVYRTYDEMAGHPESLDDGSGHGTAVAMAAAGLRVTSPKGEIEGAAPAAWLGVYKIFAGPNGDSSNTAIALKAIDDAAADGMDVVNMSFGFQPQVRPDYDVLVPAIARAATLGVAFVRSIGNSGPARFTGSGPNIGSSGLTVGASWSDRVFSSGLRIDQGEPISAVPASGALPEAPITARLKDVARWDPSGLACDPIPAEGALTGAAVLILRGQCAFETKVRMAQEAGAVAAIIYTHAASPNAGTMDLGGATFPAVMISNRNGLAVKAALAENEESNVEISFVDNLPFSLDSDGISDFSSRGPGVDGQIRPDVLAVGEEILTATQSKNPNGDLFGASGFTVANGTSFSAPLVSGSYAVLKAARPGLAPWQYRSLLINSAQKFPAMVSRPAPIQVGGAGRMDLLAALRSNLAMEPASISYGIGGRRIDSARTVKVQNLGQDAASWSVQVDSADEIRASVEPARFTLGQGEAATLNVLLPYAPEAGEYQGFLLFRREGSSGDEAPQRVPYWYGVPSGKPAAITVLPSAPASGEGGSVVTVTVLITDAIGATVPGETPQGKVLEGAGDFLDVTSEDLIYPGYWRVRFRLGAISGQTNRFRIEADDVVREVSIRTK